MDIIDQIIEREGKPDEVILIDPTLRDETLDVVLVYRQKGMLIADGQPVPMESIRSITFNNGAITPYFPSAYQVIINTTLPGREYIHLPAGGDLGWARQVCDQLREAVG